MMGLPLTGILIATGVVSWFANRRPELKEFLLLHPYRIKHAQEWHRLITHAFVHGDATHLLVNLFVLWQFGGEVERILNEFNSVPFIPLPGKYTFTMLYFGGIAFATIPGLIRHANNPTYRSLGASGAVSAVLIFYILHYPMAKLYLFFLIPLPAFAAGILFFVYERHMDKRGGTGIAHDAHLWGGLFGLIFAALADRQVFLNFLESVWAYFSA